MLASTRSGSRLAEVGCNKSYMQIMVARGGRRRSCLLFTPRVKSQEIELRSRRLRQRVRKKAAQEVLTCLGGSAIRAVSCHDNLIYALGTRVLWGDLGDHPAETYLFVAHQIKSD